MNDKLRALNELIAGYEEKLLAIQKERIEHIGNKAKVAELRRQEKFVSTEIDKFRAELKKLEDARKSNQIAIIGVASALLVILGYLASFTELFTNVLSIYDRFSPTLTQIPLPVESKTPYSEAANIATTTSTSSILPTQTPEAHPSTNNSHIITFTPEFSAPVANSITTPTLTGTVTSITNTSVLSTVIGTSTATDTPTSQPTDNPTTTPTSTSTTTPTETVTPQPPITPRAQARITPQVRGPTALTDTKPEDKASSSDSFCFSWVVNSGLETDQVYELVFWRKGQTHNDGQAWDSANPIASRCFGVSDRPPGEYYWGVWLASYSPTYHRIQYLGGGNSFTIESIEVGEDSNENPEPIPAPRE